MLRCCSVMKAKGQVRLRKRQMKGGGWSLYLDIYEKGMRRYEYLRMYLAEERTPADRQKNAETLRVAEAVRARRMIELQARGAGLAVSSSKTIAACLDDWLETRKGRSKGTLEVWTFWARKVKAWKGSALSLKDLTPAWWEAYETWVRGLGLGATTIHHYLARMRCVLNRAEKDGLLAVNPAKNARISGVRKAERIYLTADELSRLKRVSCPDREVGRAFLFGCFTGLRYSDIKTLDWRQVEGRRLVARIRKTGKTEYLELNAQAVEVMGDPGTGRVFQIPVWMGRVEHLLREWAALAGVQKHITFHTSRHTFAVLMLSAGVDIYTLSRLLGHSSVTTTQIYADIVDARKRQAVDLFPQIE